MMSRFDNFVADDRIAVDPVYSNGNRPARLGTVTRVRGMSSIDVVYDGNTSTSNIDPRIARRLKEGES